jgi:flagellar protein FliT
VARHPPRGDWQGFGGRAPRLNTVNAKLMDCYRAIEAASQQMLEAARMADWNEVVRYEGACAVLIEQLRQRAQTETMTAAERRDKTRIMQQILRNDAQVRLLIEPWVGELDKLLRPRMASLLH